MSKSKKVFHLYEIQLRDYYYKYLRLRLFELDGSECRLNFRYGGHTIADIVFFHNFLNYVVEGEDFTSLSHRVYSQIV